MSDSAESDPDILVIERTRADYDRWQQTRFRLGFVRVTSDPAFARWLADPKSGRFLIFDLLGDSPESLAWNVDTEEELIEVLAGKIVQQLKEVYAGKRDRVSGIGTLVSEEIEAKLQRMRGEILAIIDGSDARPSE
jgi:hypothetical protein